MAAPREPASAPRGDGRFSPRRSLIARLTLLVALAAAALSALLLAAGFTFGRAVLRKEIDAHLSSVASSRHDMVLAHLAQLQQRAVLLADHGEFRGLFHNLKSGQPETGGNRKYSQARLDDLTDHRTVLAAAVVDAGGRVLLANEGAEAGGGITGEAFFQKGLVAPYVGPPRWAGGRFEVALSAPIRDFNLPPKNIAVLVMTVDVAPLAAAVRDTTGLGTSGEVLLGMREGGAVRTLFPPRRRAENIAIPLAGARGLAVALEGREFLGTERDYRGVPALVAALPVGYGGWALAAKMDEREAYAPIGRALHYGLLLGALAAVAGLASAYVLARGVTRPVRRLVEGAERVAAGDLETRVAVRSADEFGILASRFNEMTAALRSRSAERAAKETALRESEAALAGERTLLRTLIDLLPDPIYIKDRASRFLAANETCALVMGAKSPAELLGKTDADFYSAEQAAVFRADEERIFAGEALPEKEEPILFPDGREGVVLTIKMPLKDAAGNITGLVGIGRNITERKRAADAHRESEKRLRLVIDLVPHFIFAKDRAGCFIFANRALAQAFGLTPEELVGRSDTELAPNVRQVAQFLSDDSEVIETGRAKFIAEEPHTGADGRTRILQTMKIPFHVPGTGAPAVLGVSVDITERQQAEAEVRRLNASLGQRVAERTAQLEEANKELEGFSYSVSHDLRAPLRAINGYAHMLLQRYGDKLDDEGRRVGGVIRREAERMGRLIDALLAFSRLGRRTVAAEPVEMTALAREAFAEATSEAVGRAIDFHCAELPPARGDRTLLRQVWVNLFSNAVKFSRQREPAVIEAGARVAENGETIWWVRDNGAGFDPRYSEQLFGVFQRLHTQEEFEGTGVGLAFVQRIVHRHGGRIWGEGKPGEGATFFFTLQAAPSAPAPIR